MINITYFLNKYGQEFIDYLLSEIVVDDFGHQVVDVPQNRN